jgi:hypothetical protein
MAYRASTYRPGIEDEPNLPASRSVRERSPRRNGRRSPGREASAGQGPRRLDRRENRSRSPDRSSPILSTSRRMSESDKRNHEREFRAKEALGRRKDISEKAGERRQPDVPPKEISDREWDKFQDPIHARIGGYADELIRDGWYRGEKVTKQNSPRFAADVLCYVRKRFYDDVAKDEAAARAAGREPKRDPPNGPYTQRLILENMKWVCDTKIKPLTDIKELFLCNGCENNHKFYSFESVLQHYAAKHTTALSSGTIVVNWRAEWPEHPPFNPEPDAAMNTFHSVAPSITMSPNGPPTSPRGFVGYAENKELEKKKREQELREREIQIKEVKEEIERKEREKAKREYESKERQIRAAEVAERNKRELEDKERESRAKEDAAYKKSLIDNQRGSGVASSAQQNGRSILQGRTFSCVDVFSTATTLACCIPRVADFQTLNPVTIIPAI